MNELSLLDSLFNGDGFGFPTARNGYHSPKVDAIQTQNSYIIKMDLPGLTENDVDITLKNDVLTIASAEKEKQENTENEQAENKEIFLIHERLCSDSLKFRRSFTLPKDIDPTKVNASFKNGVLSVEIARKEESPEQKIKILVA